ncbi:inositol-pentakisphosphate 2-kinase-like [Anneissia japonica]|uniref:inositol-pentakisphosphate 2-kinase-like n=1 Tax=Anneissia japonica TaxID=1529436 RepID=UPI00142581AF|nr:inositol-pentakisphosphate 2-kinase-like [Anneissia japonica]XP_033106077.1 inositol-pentakisphosphate 2-kinase-like [Anneissia japonica]XP_033106078.1 inositol-pentakisphosphate 2-kinase-like [Anneissia japonica]
MDISDWIYRGEGNSSLVISNIKERKVYKLRKREFVKTECNDTKTVGGEDSLQRCRRTLQYSEQVLRPLLGEQFVAIAEIVPISKDFINSVSEKVRKSRPLKRLNTEIDEYSGYGICLPDFCFMQPSNSKNLNPVLCVEIKPKMGLLPDLKQISPERSIKRSACRFCMYQKLKLSLPNVNPGNHKVEYGTWESASLYCPLDLFSGNEDRMMYALNCLIKTPQNNLRVFLNGRLIFANNGRYMPTLDDHKRLVDILKLQFEKQDKTTEDDHKDFNHSCLQDFLHVIRKVLMVSEVDSESTPRVSCTRPQTNKHCLASCYKSKSKKESENSSLPSGCILDRILKVQQYDDLDIEGIYPLYQRLQEHLAHHPEDREKYCLEGPFSQSFIEQLPKMPKLTENINSSIESTLDYAVQKIREFLIAATTKDCSIMLTLQQASATQMEESIPSISSRNGSRFLYQCRIVDLDPKPSTRIPMYDRLDQDITQYYKKYYEHEDMSS